MNQYQLLAGAEKDQEHFNLVSFHKLLWSFVADNIGILRSNDWGLTQLSGFECCQSSYQNSRGPCLAMDFTILREDNIRTRKVLIYLTLA